MSGGLEGSVAATEDVVAWRARRGAAVRARMELVKVLRFMAAS
jgi:hypothetical protein